MRLLFVFALVIALLCGAASPGFAATGDADGDRIPNDVEVSLCGTETCATGREDRDRDGIPDWVELVACGARECANPKRDADDDGIPDYAERLVCGSDTCANSREDADRDGISDWVEFVICGDRTCATGDEDYDGNGVSDAAQLAACVTRVDALPITGQPAFWLGIAVAVFAVSAGGSLLLWRRIQRSRRRHIGEPGDDA